VWHWVSSVKLELSRGADCLGVARGFLVPTFLAQEKASVRTIRELWEPVSPAKGLFQAAMPWDIAISAGSKSCASRGSWKLSTTVKPLESARK